jgi:hypothetical protein
LRLFGPLLVFCFEGGDLLISLLIARALDRFLHLRLQRLGRPWVSSSNLNFGLWDWLGPGCRDRRCAGNARDGEGRFGGTPYQSQSQNSKEKNSRHTLLGSPPKAFSYKAL